MKLAELARNEAPACWSWNVPNLRPQPDVADLLARHQLPQRVCSNAVSGAPALWRFIEFHAGRCAVCGDVAGLLVVDHKHGPRTVRGCLCHGCNMLEGRGGRDLPIFVEYRRRHPALMLGYYEPYRGNGASQRVLRAVHAAARAQRHRELRVADMSSWIRLLARSRVVRADNLLRSKVRELGQLWQRVAEGSDQVTPQLMHDLAVFRKHAFALADGEQQLDLDLVLALVASLGHEYRQLMGGAGPLVMAAQSETVVWSPPWER